MHWEVSPFRQILTNQAIDILVGTLLPEAVGNAKINRNARFLSDCYMRCHLTPLIIDHAFSSGGRHSAEAVWKPKNQLAVTIFSRIGTTIGQQCASECLHLLFIHLKLFEIMAKKHLLKSVNSFYMLGRPGSAALCSHRLDKPLGTEDIHDAFHVVGKHMKAHFRSDVLKPFG